MSKEYDEKMAKIRAGHPRAYDPWTPEEDAQLLKEFKAGHTVKELAELFSRQPGAIRSRLDKIQSGKISVAPVSPDVSEEEAAEPDPLPEQDLAGMIPLLNALYENPYQWQVKKAQKRHRCLFRKRINPGDYYFRLSDGTRGFEHDLKLSQDSMARLLFMLFSNNPHLTKITKNIDAERFQKMRNLVDKLRR